MTKHKLLEDLKSHFETIGVIRNLAQECNQKLIDFLLKDSQYSNEYKSRFFLESAGMLIFKQLDFLTFLDLKNLGGSFTSYASKIGLSSKTRGLLKASNEVVLNFAYKDGVLKGGQSKDEEKQDEIFFNEILAKDEIDTLFEPKALHNFEAIGDESLEKLIAEESNILIKGNNLLALHSLKKKYQGKVKLIYIDPPYNTGSDSFKYNDKFNHSTWLTFMKNRLEIAREFLRDNGVIFIQCDDNEQAYLKVLMDEIFGRDNFVNCIAVLSSTPSGVKISHANKKILKSKDYILVYKKVSITFKPQYIRKGAWDTHYMFFVEDNKLLKLYDVLRVRDILNEHEKLSDFNINNPKHREFYLKNGDYIVRKSTHNNQAIKKICRDRFQDKIYADGINLYFNNDQLQPISRSFQEVIIGQQIEKDISNLLCDFWGDIDFQNTQNQGGVSFTNAKKPEQLLYRIISMTTCTNDIVMDFFAGSGTTLAVAHKMGRKWIGIEQMDYIQDITKERLRKVIDGEQGGISKVAEWKGGGSFIYAELMPFNAIYRERIEASQDEKELETIYKDLEEKAFLDYRVDLQEILADQDFKNMSLEDKKETLRLILDENMDYVPLGDIEDKTYGIDEDTIRLNKMFYGEEQ